MLAVAVFLDTRASFHNGSLIPRFLCARCAARQRTSCRSKCLRWHLFPTRAFLRWPSLKAPRPLSSLSSTGCLLPGFPARFFRFWMAGWTCLRRFGELAHVLALARWRPMCLTLSSALSFSGCGGFILGGGPGMSWAERKPLKHLWPLGCIAAMPIVALLGLASRCLLGASGPNRCSSACFIFQPVGSFGGRKLAPPRIRVETSCRRPAAARLHGLDQPHWAAHRWIFRVSFQGLFGITMGIAMAVLVLEAGRAARKISTKSCAAWL